MGNKVEYVYVLKSNKRDDMFKIGKTINLENRIKQFYQTSRHLGITDEEFEFVRTIPVEDSNKLERDMHRCFADNRVVGEWFDLKLNDIDEYIANIDKTEYTSHKTTYKSCNSQEIDDYKIYFDVMIANMDISNEAIAAYLSILSNYSKCNRAYIDKNYLAYELKLSFDCSRRFGETLECGLKDLVNSGVISNIEGKMYDISNITDLQCNGYYITRRELTNIMTYKNIKGFDVFAFLRYYISILSSMKKGSVYGNKIIDILRDVCNISKNSALSYNKILEEINIIYIHRTNVSINFDNLMNIRLGNYYGRIEHKEIIIQEHEKFIEQLIHPRIE